MKRADRLLALKAGRLASRSTPLSPGAIAMKLRVEPSAVQTILNRGLAIVQSESHRLTDNEELVMATLARVEARRVELGFGPMDIRYVDHAAGKRSGWTNTVIQERLRQARPLDAGVRAITNRLDFVCHPHPAGKIWLTPAGWAFVWATGLILKNWKVPG